MACPVKGLVRRYRDSHLLLAPRRTHIDEAAGWVKHQKPTLTVEFISWLLDKLRAHRLCRPVDLVDIRNHKGHIHPGWHGLEGSRDEVMRPLDNAELKVQGGRGTQLYIPIAVVLDFEVQQPNVEITGCGEIVGADVREDTAEGHGGREVREQYA